MPTPLNVNWLPDRNLRAPMSEFWSTVIVSLEEEGNTAVFAEPVATIPPTQFPVPDQSPPDEVDQ
jgi:hypothetical protein